MFYNLLFTFFADSHDKLHRKDLSWSADNLLQFNSSDEPAPPTKRKRLVGPVPLNYSKHVQIPLKFDLLLYENYFINFGTVVDFVQPGSSLISFFYKSSDY